jgi:hypothetical protein
MNKTFVTNTQIAPIVDVSTYEGPFSYESLWQPDEESEREEGRVVCWDYDSKKMGERIVEEANRVFEAEKPLAGYGVVEIRATKFGSPREYNFMSDWLDLHVKVDESFFKRARRAILDPENRKAVVEHCKAHWVSKDGFNSFMLNRVHNLSLNWWEHEHYGRHMSTDEEIEEAVMSDLQEVLVMLEEETSEDEFRDFGAVLALLWRFDYPGDFDRRRSESWSGSWVADEMVDHLRGNSSLSEFCTVLDKDEVKARFGAHMIDFGARRLAFAEELGKYAAADFVDKARVGKICAAFRGKVGKVLDELEDSQLNVIANHATGDKSEDGKVNDLLDDFREEAEPKMTAAAFMPLWAEASREAM